MATLSTITTAEKSDCVGFAVEMAKTAIGSERGYVSPTARVGTLSDFEWEKLVMGAVSGWIAERSRQVGARFLDEEYMLATGEVPAAYDLGLAALLLPGLGDLIEGMSLADKPIGEWSRNEICLFVWTAAEMLQSARARIDERPVDSADPSDVLMAG
jgi:hypothetical protein